MVAPLMIALGGFFCGAGVLFEGMPAYKPAFMCRNGHFTICLYVILEYNIKCLYVKKHQVEIQREDRAGIHSVYEGHPGEGGCGSSAGLYGHVPVMCFHRPSDLTGREQAILR